MILAPQLTENLQRVDLDLIDAAQAVVRYIKYRHGDEAFDRDGIINTIILLDREPDRVEKELVYTVSTIQKLSGTSLRSLDRTCSLRKDLRELVTLVEGRHPEAIDDGAPTEWRRRRKNLSSCRNAMTDRVSHYFMFLECMPHA